MQHQNRAMRSFMHNVSRFGDWPSHVALGFLLAGIAWWRGSKEWTRIFVAMLIALALAGLIAQGMKFATRRSRPFVKSAEVWKGPQFASRFQSFSSGHVAESVAFFGVLLFVNLRIGLICLPIPLLIGYSRICVAEHYLSDLVVAATLGLICAIVVAFCCLAGSGMLDEYSE